jgi:hypothetical protein
MYACKCNLHTVHRFLHFLYHTFSHFDVVGFILNMWTHFSAQSTNQTHCPSVSEIGYVLELGSEAVGIEYCRSWGEVKLGNVRITEQFRYLSYVIASKFSLCYC